MWYTSNLYSVVYQLYLNRTGGGGRQCGAGTRTDIQINGNRIKGSEINPYINDQLIFNMRTKAIQWGKNSIFNK